jgi:glycosyltransferase involved in cell wall biosynthesis
MSSLSFEGKVLKMLREKELTNGASIADRCACSPSDAGTPELPSVAILLCTLQGIAHLSEQLDSICHQGHKSWSIWASDDGSDDGTLAVLDDYQKKLGESRLTIFQGPGQGFAANFLSLTCNVQIQADYYAYSDQDDVWDANKLARALECLNGLPRHMPALYCSRTLNVDVNNRKIGLSRHHTKKSDFANALVQSIGGGNTMLFNDAARQLLLTAGADIRVVSHDWWAYMLISGCGGHVLFDNQALVRYRQHEKNLVGSSSGWSAGLTRARLMIGGTFKMWNDVNLLALQSMRTHLTLENQHRFDAFSKARQSGFFSRLAGLTRSGVHRQTLMGNIGLVAASIFNKI